MYKSAPEAIWTYFNIQASPSEEAGAFEGKMFDIAAALPTAGSPISIPLKATPILSSGPMLATEQNIPDHTTILKKKLVELAEDESTKKTKPTYHDRDSLLVFGSTERQRGSRVCNPFRLSVHRTD